MAQSQSQIRTGRTKVQAFFADISASPAQGLSIFIMRLIVSLIG
jgi:hypothetical protein